jgi:5-methylcytosine-specific restriction protein A
MGTNDSSNGRHSSTGLSELTFKASRYRPVTSDEGLSFPDEVRDGIEFREGSVRRVLVNAYERDPRARRQCIAKYGNHCSICKLSFAERYGKAAQGFIHVYHLRQLSEIREDYAVDPERDLRPVCPNCHAVLHRRNPPYTIEEVRRFLGSH